MGDNEPPRSHAPLSVFVLNDRSKCDMAYCPVHTEDWRLIQEDDRSTCCVLKGDL
jgi:hypothetical protein